MCLCCLQLVRAVGQLSGLTQLQLHLVSYEFESVEPGTPELDVQTLLALGSMHDLAWSMDLPVKGDSMQAMLQGMP